jgi:hypothetical protein
MHTLIWISKFFSPVATGGSGIGFGSLPRCKKTDLMMAVGVAVPRSCCGIYWLIILFFFFGLQ